MARLRWVLWSGGELLLPAKAFISMVRRSMLKNEIVTSAPKSGTQHYFFSRRRWRTVVRRPFAMHDGGLEFVRECPSRSIKHSFSLLFLSCLFHWLVLGHQTRVRCLLLGCLFCKQALSISHSNYNLHKPASKQITTPPPPTPNLTTPSQNRWPDEM